MSKVTVTTSNYRTDFGVIVTLCHTATGWNYELPKFAVQEDIHPLMVNLSAGVWRVNPTGSILTFSLDELKPSLTNE